MQQKRLILMVGISGSGKSTLARTLVADQQHICSADDYFKDDKGNYNFDASKLKDAHEKCQLTTEILLNDDVPIIVVDNTNLSFDSQMTYQKLAQEYGYACEIRFPEAPHWKEFADHYRNTHGDCTPEIEAFAQHNVHRVDAKILKRQCYRFFGY